MKSIIFSIIIPVYNVEKYLRQCLDSVLSQDFPDFEVICINDGSTDRSLAILQEYANRDKRIQIISQPNGGLSDARNTGIKAAKGDYIFLLDSDDWIEPNALEILNKNVSNEDMICFNGRRWFENGKTEESDIGINEPQIAGWNYYNKYALVPRKFHFVCTVLRLYKRSFLIDYNFFFKEGIYHEDNLFTPIACYYAQRIKVIPDSLYIYRIREGSITQNADTAKNKKRIIDIATIANELADFFIPKTDIDKSMVYREIAGEYFKGFMPDEIKRYGNNDKILKQIINWRSFRTVAVYPRHKRIYWLLTISPSIFRLYIKIESLIKNR